MITREKFIVLVGCEPKDDDLDRANCTQAGTIGHFDCGVCPICGKPRFCCVNSIQHEPDRYTERKIKPGVWFKLRNGNLRMVIVSNNGYALIDDTGKVRSDFYDNIYSLLNKKTHVNENFGCFMNVMYSLPNE